MISILIPVYNYAINNLVSALLLQLDKLDVNWEILISDDVSSPNFLEENNQFIHKLSRKNVKLFQQNTNIGNGANRNFLIGQSLYKWLIFLDADVLPVENNFISIYLNKLSATSKEIVAGNIVYDSQNPYPNLLRWKYGKRKEEISFKERRKCPILNVRGANFAIKRELALNHNFPELYKKYGFIDTRFFLQFSENEVEIIENPVYHLGIESNEIFLRKSQNAISNALFLLNKKDKLANKIAIVSTYKKVRVFKRLFSFVYAKLNENLVRNLTSENPSVFIFQFYKLLYISYLDVSVKVN